MVTRLSKCQLILILALLRNSSKIKDLAIVSKLLEMVLQEMEQFGFYNSKDLKPNYHNLNLILVVLLETKEQL